MIDLIDILIGFDTATKSDSEMSDVATEIQHDFWMDGFEPPVFHESGEPEGLVIKTMQRSISTDLV